MSDERRGGLFDQVNDVVRIDRVEEFDDDLSVAVRSFFREVDAPHLFDERVAPILHSPDSQVFLAVRDRPWPPWGLGSRKVGALVQVQKVDATTYGLSPVYAADEDATNIGLSAAVYADALEELSREEGTEVSYAVIEGSVLVDRVLRKVGFEPSDDLIVTEKDRYRLYRVPAATLRHNLGLDRLSVPELLAHEIDDDTFERLALFLATLHLGSQPTRFNDRVVREILTIVGGLFDASLPGGVPPSPSPTALPAIIEPGDVILPGDTAGGPV